MNTLKFKTNIKCTACEATVTPFLNNTVGENNWKVDLQNVDRVLTVESDDATNDKVVKALKEAGYTAEPLP